MFFCPQKPNYPERSLSNLGQRRFSPLHPLDPLLNVSHPTIKNTLSDHCGANRLHYIWLKINCSFLFPGPAPPSITVSCIFALSCQVCSSTPPPSSLSCSLYLCWAGKGQGQRISTIYSSKTFALAVFFVGFRSPIPGTVLQGCWRILRNRFRTAQLDGITRSVRARKQINRLHFMPPILALLYTADESQSKHNESIMKSALAMESGHCSLIYIGLFEGFVECVCMFDGNCLKRWSQISSSFLLKQPKRAVFFS